jgi:hypothetical protein
MASNNVFPFYGILYHVCIIPYTLYTHTPLLPSTTGNYTITLSAEGSDSELFPDISTEVLLIPWSFLIPPPSLVGAAFVNTGGALYITFDQPSNQAGSATFPCGSLFVFVSADESTCYWLSSTLVRHTHIHIHIHIYTYTYIYTNTLVHIH